MKKIFLFAIIFFYSICAFSAYLKNSPIDLTQPDGSIIHCFITGDEFHRRVHDKDNFTIIQDPTTGFYVYALLEHGELKPSEYVVGQVNLKTVPIQPGYDISVKQIEKKKETTLKAGELGQPSTKGDFNNIVISIRFSDQGPTPLKLQDYENNFNSLSAGSLKSYFREVSSSQLNVTSNFYPQPQGQTISEYQDAHPRAYYCTYNAITNPIGYKNNEVRSRQESLIKNAIAFVQDQIVGSKINYDLNNDGFIDNLCVIIQGDPDSFGNLLWPSLINRAFMDSKIKIGNYEVSQFEKILSTWFDWTVICHEFFHLFGAPDLYRNYNTDIDPVGGWDNMCINYGQHMTTYLKWKYGSWFEEIPTITQPGTYSLLPVSKSANACYKILSPDNPTEYFVVEYRKKEGLFENRLPSIYDDGLIIYRINSNYTGNLGGPPDELYIYRKGGTTSINGDLSKAAFSSNSNSTVFNIGTNPSCFLSNGSKGWIDISNVSSSGNQISFTVNYVLPLSAPRNLTLTAEGNQIRMKWNTPVKKEVQLLGYKVYLENSLTPLNSSLVSDTTYLTPIPGLKNSYLYKVYAVYQLGESDPTVGNYINLSTPSVKDSLTLVTLYNQCNGPNWTKKTNWLLGPISTWQGVTVQNGRVVFLRLDSNGLKGPIPDFLSNLTEIKRIWLNSNNLIGNLPDSWSSLVNLNLLGLGANQLSSTLPSSWLSMKSMIELGLDGNQISGPLPDSWSSLENIQIIHLNNNKLTGNLPVSWSGMKTLQKLYLNNNQLSGNLPSSWSELVNLQELYLHNNQLSGNLPSSWSELINLKEFHLYRNQISGSLPDGWSSMKNLMNLYISNNNLAGILPRSWSSLGNLVNLELSFNNLTGQLPDSWSSLANLQFLNLCSNELSGDVPDKWWSSTAFVNLTNLLLNKNKLTGIPYFLPLKKLKALDISYNYLDFGDIEPVFDVLKGYTYIPQENIGTLDTISKKQGEELRMSGNVGGKNNHYQWYKGASVIEGANRGEYVIPKVTTADEGSYHCLITNSLVTDLKLSSNEKIVKILVPVANAGSNQTVIEGSVVTLDGSASSSPEGKQLTYKWTYADYYNVLLSSSSSPSPTFIAPPIWQDVTFIFYLVVNDGTQDSKPSPVYVFIKNIHEAPIANAGVDQSVKEGSPVTLNGYASLDPELHTLTYKWNAPIGISLSSTTSPQPTFIAPKVTQVTSYIFNLVVNNGIDSPADQVIITVNPLPSSAGIISGTANVCLGQNSVIYSVPNISNATSYIWTLPPGASGSSTTNSITLDYGISAVNGNITVKGHNDCGDGTISTMAITVNPLPLGASTITGASTICQGQNAISYSVPVITNAISYIWTLPAGATGISTTNTITVNYNTSAISGNITVKGHNSCGDGTISTLAITVNSIPASAGTITGTANVCQGQNTLVYSVPSIANAASYIWTLPKGATGSSNTNSITVNYETSTISGNITVKGHNDCGEGVGSNLPIMVNPIPITPFITQNGKVLSSNSTSGNQWYNQNIPISGATAQDYTITTIGEYTAKVTLNGCASLPSNMIKDVVTSITSLEYNDKIRIYPNPVSDDLTIEFKGNTDEIKYAIYSSSGQLVTTGVLLESTVVHTSSFSSGVYTIKFNTGKTFDFRKVIKQN